MAEKKFAVDLNLMNNELKNARIDSRGIDPTVLYAGLFWYNLTEKTLKYSDGTAIYNIAVGGSLDAAIAQANSYTDSAISNEVTNRNSAIDSAISSEVTNRDSAITNAIAAEVAARDTAISTAIGNEVTARDSAIAASAQAVQDYTDNTVASAIATEVTNRDNAITNAILGEVTNRDEAITLAITSAQAAIQGTIDAAIATEVTNRDNAIAAEATARDVAISTAVNSAVSSLDGSIASEATSRAQGDADTLAAANSYTDSQIASLSGDFMGDFDASLGTLPSAVGIKAGSNWRVSVGGTIAGLTPVSTLEIGDLIVARIDNASTAANFFVLQGNMSDSVTFAGDNVSPSKLLFSSNGEGRIATTSSFSQTDIAQAAKTFYIYKDLVANTPVTYRLTNVPGNVTSSVTYMSTVTVIDSTDGSEVFIGVRRTADTFILTSNVSFSANIVINTPIFVASIVEQIA